MTDDDGPLSETAGPDDDVPVPGGPSGRVVLAEVVSTELSATECSVMVSSRASGAVVAFAGVVRDHDDGRGVTALHYEAHPSAGDVMAEVAEQIAALVAQSQKRSAVFDIVTNPTDVTVTTRKV